MSELTGWEPTIVDDDEVSNSRSDDRYSGREPSEYWLRMPQIGKSITVRFLGVPKKYYCHFNNMYDQEQGKTAKKNFPDHDAQGRGNFRRRCTDPKTREERSKQGTDCAWCRLKYQRSDRYLASVIDREGGEMMILDLPKTAFKQIATWWAKPGRKKIMPGGPGDMENAAPDFIITRDDQTTYSIVPEMIEDDEGGEKPVLKALSAEDLTAIKAWNPKAQTPEEQLTLHDVDRYTSGHYMTHSMQTELFGEILQQNPYEKKGDDSAPKEEFEKEDSKPKTESAVEDLEAVADVDEDEGAPVKTAAEIGAGVKVENNSTDDDDENFDW